MSRVTRREWYERVNGAWPAQVPPLTAEEAVRAARRLWRYGRGRTWTGEVRVTSGRRHTWVWGGVLYVNPEKGWHDLVHMLSHLCERSEAHGSTHARMELRMIKQVVRRGWLEGKLRTPAREPRPQPPVQAVRYARVLELEKAWQRKAKLAATKLRILRRRRRYYERQQAVAVVPAV